MPSPSVDLQRSLIGTSLDDPARKTDVPMSLVDRIQTVRQLRVTARYRMAAATAAECMPDAHAAAARPRDRGPARDRLVHLCFDAAICARILGDTGTAWIAAERCRQVAELNRRPVALAAAGYARAYVALARTAPARSVQIAESSLDRLDPTTPDLAAMTGMLHLIAALGTVRVQGRLAAAEAHLNGAQRMLEAAEGNTDPFALQFNHVTLMQWRVNVALEVGDITTAAATFAHVDLSRIEQPNQQALYFLDLARIYATLGRTRSAADMLERAELLSREYVANSSVARRLRETLAAQLPTVPEATAS